MEGALEEKLEGGIGDLGKDRKQMKSAIAGGKEETKTIKKELKGGKQDWHTAQRKDMKQKEAGLFSNLFVGAGLQTSMLI